MPQRALHQPMNGAKDPCLGAVAGLESLVGLCRLTIYVDGVKDGEVMDTKLRSNGSILRFPGTAVSDRVVGKYRKNWRWRRAADLILEVEFYVQTVSGSLANDALMQLFDTHSFHCWLWLQ